MRCKFYAIVLGLGVFAILCIYYTASKSSIHNRNVDETDETANQVFNRFIVTYRAEVLHGENSEMRRVGLNHREISDEKMMVLELLGWNMLRLSRNVRDDDSMARFISSVRIFQVVASEIFIQSSNDNTCGIMSRKDVIACVALFFHMIGNYDFLLVKKAIALVSNGELRAEVEKLLKKTGDL
jgi:hypothetical protein